MHDRLIIVSGLKVEHILVVVIQEETQESRQAGWESVEIDRNETHVS
jgi:hypothetical protein